MIGMRTLALAGILAVFGAGSAYSEPPAGQSPTQPAQPQRDPDLDFDPRQPDFTLAALPTTLRLPRFKSAFRVTHRFGRSLGAGDFTDLLEDAFGLDSGAQIGLEYRFAILSGTQVGIHRTNSNRTIEFFGETNILRQGVDRPFGLSVLAAVEGTNNFRDNRSPSLGVIFSSAIWNLGTVYLEPLWVGNTNPALFTPAENDRTFLIGIGTRIAVRPTVYVLAEIAPRPSGYDPNAHHGSFAVEKRAGGHIFQVNVSNGFGTTLGQVARGGANYDDWHLGFNISRKFF
jgi:hypothetical protein